MSRVSQMQLVGQFITIVVVFFQLLTGTAQVNLVAVENCQTRLVLVYNKPSSYLNQQSTTNFTLNFDYAFTNKPIFAVGNAGYSSADTFINEFWQIKGAISSSYTFIIVSVRVQANTKTNMLRINYIAVDNMLVGPYMFSIFQILYTNSSNLTNTSTGSGTRTDTLYYSLPSGSFFNPTAIVQCFTNTIYMYTSTSFNFKTSCGLYIQVNALGQNYSNSIQFIIEAFGSILLDRVSFFAVVINISILKPYNYYQVYLGQIDVTSPTSIEYSTLTPTTSTTQAASLSVPNINTSNFLNLLSGLGSNSPNKVFNFSWGFNLSSINITALRIQNPTNITIRYRYLLFGRVNCTLWSVPLQDCVTSCESNQTNQIYSTMCIACQGLCKTCSIAATYCTSCYSGHFIFENICFNCNETFLGNITAKLTQCGSEGGGEQTTNSTNSTNDTNNTNNTDTNTTDNDTNDTNTTDDNTTNTTNQTNDTNSTNTTDNTTNDTDNSIIIPNQTIIQNKNANTKSPPYWIASFLVIPFIGILTYCYYKHKIKTVNKVDNEKLPTYNEYPTIQF